MKQSDAVVEAMRRHGGFATLAQLFLDAPKVEGAQFGGKTPNATIRKIVQIDNRFFKIRPGLWALTEYKNKIPFIQDALAPINSERNERFDHSYYQGLLVLIGNLKNFQTYIPPQDKNRIFLDKRLSEIAKVEKLPSFSYQGLVNRAKSVDVIWLNTRQMPSALLEVENSTDMQNSLLKFFDLQDFYTQFKIVAPSNRRKDFESKISREVFQPIKSRVDFITYEDTVVMYEVLSKQNGIQSKF
jgi:hypothetical protein